MSNLEDEENIFALRILCSNSFKDDGEIKNQLLVKKRDEGIKRIE